MDDIKIISLVHRLNMIQGATKIVLVTLMEHLPDDARKEVLEAMKLFDEQDKLFDKELESALDAIEKGRING